MASVLGAQRTQSGAKDRTLQVPSDDRISRAIEGGGFLRSVAGDDFDLAVKAISESVRQSKGLLLTGSCGCGKTMLMRILYSRCGHSRYWYSLPSDDCLWTMDARQNRNIRESYQEWPFIDDLGTEVRTEYGRRVDFVADYIRMYHDNAYMNLGGRMFVTTNLDSNGLLELYDERVVDRLMDMCVVLRFGGSSKRERTIVK
jgi:hypothetical protein